MVVPQVENGFTRIANEILDNLIMINLSSYQFRVLFFIIRKTYGYNKADDWISNSQIVDGTGIKKSHVSRTKKELLERCLIVTSSGNKTKLNKMYKQWVKLPRQVTVTNLGTTVTNSGTEKLPNQGHTKDNKNNIQKTEEKSKKFDLKDLSEDNKKALKDKSESYYNNTKRRPGKHLKLAWGRTLQSGGHLNY